MELTFLEAIERAAALGGTGYLVFTLWLLITGRVVPYYVLQRLEQSLKEMATDRDFYRDKFLALSEKVASTVKQARKSEGGGP